LEDENDDISLTKGDNPIPRIRMGEIGSTGLKVSDGYVYEECKKEFRTPFWQKEVKKMMMDPVVSAGIEIYKMWLARSVPVVVPYDDDEDHVAKAKFIEQCMKDMEHTFDEFFSDVLSYIPYGFAPIEMVFKKRLKEMGSKYNDGLVGWKKLPIRSQDSLDEWVFSDDGRELLAMKQDINGLNYTERFNNLLKTYGDGIITIPMEKLMLFRYNPTRGNPEGHSLLKSAWIAWKYRTQLELDESVGIQRSLQGIPVYYIEPSYMSADAADDKKAVYNEVQRQVRNFSRNEQSGFVIPNVFDQHSKQRLFSLETVDVNTGNQYDTNAIIRRWDLKILTTLLADVLALGQEGNGSFALSENKTALMQMALEARLKEISTVIQNTLIKTTFAMNGWDTSELPSIEFTYPTDVEIDNFGKLVQRIGAVNFLPRTPDTIAWVAKQMGFPEWEKFKIMSQEDLDELFTDNETGAAEGMAEGMPNGTGKSNKSGSETNSDNKG